MMESWNFVNAHDEDYRIKDLISTCGTKLSATCTNVCKQIDNHARARAHTHTEKTMHQMRSAHPFMLSDHFSFIVCVFSLSRIRDRSSYYHSPLIMCFL